MEKRGEKSQGAGRSRKSSRSRSPRKANQRTQEAGQSQSSTCRSPGGSKEPKVKQGQSVFNRLGKPVVPPSCEAGCSGDKPKSQNQEAEKPTRRQMRRAHLAKILKSGNVNPEEAWKLWRSAATREEFKKHRKMKTLLPPMPTEFQEEVGETEAEVPPHPQPEEAPKKKALEKPVVPQRLPPSTPGAGLEFFRYSSSNLPARFRGPLSFDRPTQLPCYLLRPIVPVPFSSGAGARFITPIPRPSAFQSPWARLGPLPSTSQPSATITCASPCLPAVIGMEVELPVPVESRTDQADRSREVPVIIITSPSPPTSPVEEASSGAMEVSSSPAASETPGEAWQDEARALPQLVPAVVPQASPREGIPEPVYLEERLRARREHLESQRAPGSRKKKRKRRGPRQLQMEDYEGAVPRPRDRDWDEDVLEIDEGYDDAEFFSDEEQ